jgi:hypothetical protein
VRVVARCRAAAEAAPNDPTPWIGLLRLAGVLGDNGVSMVQWNELSFEAGARSWGWFREAVLRHPDSWHAHHRMREAQLTRLRLGLAARADRAARLHDRRRGQRGGAFAAARHAAHAHVELRLAATAALLGEAERDWLAQRGDQDLQEAYRAWFRGSERAHPAAPHDLNILAYQLVESGRPSLAHPGLRGDRPLRHGRALDPGARRRPARGARARPSWLRAARPRRPRPGPRETTPSPTPSPRRNPSARRTPVNRAAHPPPRPDSHLPGVIPPWPTTTPSE